MADILVDEALKHEIKSRADIVEVVNQYVKLVRDGNLYRGLCPFHKEKTPSFVVTEAGYNDNQYGSFYCYGCHAGNKEETKIGNDVIAFVMAMEDADFLPACQMLCDKYNIPYQRRNVDPEVIRLKQQVTQKNLQYHNNLLQNNLVLNYLKERGVDGKSITKFRLGLTPSNDFPDWKCNRLVFGITDVNYEPSKANTLAMGYRCLQGQVKSPDGMEYFPNCDIKSKYRNDAESRIFSKKKNLYGLNYAVKPIRKMGFSIVVEGYLDVILMHQTGFDNTVAPMGTSFTDEQMNILLRYTKQLLFFMDADERGLESMRRVLPRLLEKGFSVLVVEAPQGKDPAELCLELGQDRTLMANYIREHSTPALQWCTNTALALYESKVHKAKLEALDVVLPILDKVSHRPSKIAYMSSIADRLNINAALLVKEPEKVVENFQNNNSHTCDRGTVVNPNSKQDYKMPYWSNKK